MPSYILTIYMIHILKSTYANKGTKPNNVIIINKLFFQLLQKWHVQNNHLQN